MPASPVPQWPCVASVAVLKKVTPQSCVVPFDYSVTPFSSMLASSRKEEGIKQEATPLHLFKLKAEVFFLAHCQFRDHDDVMRCHGGRRGLLQLTVADQSHSCLWLEPQVAGQTESTAVKQRGVNACLHSLTCSALTKLGTPCLRMVPPTVDTPSQLSAHHQETPSPMDRPSQANLL